MAKTQKVRFSHPLRKTFYEMDVPVDKTFKEIAAMLIEEGFIGVHGLLELRTDS